VRDRCGTQPTGERRHEVLGERRLPGPRGSGDPDDHAAVPGIATTLATTVTTVVTTVNEETGHPVDQSLEVRRREQARERHTGIVVNRKAVSPTRPVRDARHTRFAASGLSREWIDRYLS